MPKAEAVSLNLEVQRQKNSEWCWAAVSTSVERFFDPSSELEQCKVVSRELHKACCGKLGRDEAKTCNIPETLDGPLSKLGWLAEGPNPGPMGFEEIRREIDHGRPVGVLIRWRADGQFAGGHFIVIAGYRVTAGGVRYVMLRDPFFPASHMTYESFCDRKGGYHDGEGIWSHHYVLRSSRKKAS
jgi:hypothetical protein